MSARPRYAYLGPAGTFTEAALLQVVAADEAELLPQADVGSAIAAVRSGDADHAVVAIESTAEGGVTATLDALAAGRRDAFGIEYGQGHSDKCRSKCVATRIKAHTWLTT